MKVVKLKDFGDSIVLHFDTKDKRINAYTLASSLVAFADAAKAANAQVNPGYEIEIVVDAVGEGSFRAKLTAVYTTANNIFSKHAASAIVLSVIASYIYERTLGVEDDVSIQINTDEVIIEKGDEKIIIPRNVYEATRDVEERPDFKKAVNKTLKTIDDDDSVSGLAFVKDMDETVEQVMIPKQAIDNATRQMEPEEPIRTVEENVSLQIIKAILEVSTRKWEFMWRGVKISAPIANKKFYEDFFAHDITIAPGDILEVKLAIRQELDAKTGIYSNKSYKVTEVYEHVPRLRQTSIET